MPMVMKVDLAAIFNCRFYIGNFKLRQTSIPGFQTWHRTIYLCITFIDRVQTEKWTLTGRNLFEPVLKPLSTETSVESDRVEAIKMYYSKLRSRGWFIL